LQTLNLYSINFPLAQNVVSRAHVAQLGSEV
jgi:hypothetical protein